MEHSNLYLELTNDRGLFDLDKLMIQFKNGVLNYDNMPDLLRECNDAHFGIVSTLDGDKWVRDATNSKPLADRISHDSPTIEANNMILRVLSRLRPIEFAIKKHLPDADSAKICAEISMIFNAWMEFIYNIQGLDSDENKLDYIKERELFFNIFLLKKLYEANLTPGVYTQEDGEKLLGHYRNLSSLLVPARTMVTLTYDKKAKVLNRETQYPVTQKTAKQKAELAKLSTVTPYPTEDEKNAHTKLNTAMQKADQAFSDLMMADDRALPAQTRKTHLVGAKNAFVVKNELFFGVKRNEIADQGDATEANTLWLARTGSPVYIGKGETSDTVLEQTKEVLQQIRGTAELLMGKEDLNLHMTMLNTVSPLENQSTIVNNTLKAVEGTEDAASYAPSNLDGTFRRLDVSDKLNFDYLEKPSGSAPLNKKWRMESISSIMRAAAQTLGFLSVVNCASGQDRTGGAVELTVQDWMKGLYLQNFVSHYISGIDEVRARGGNAAEITQHHVHGSPGMKPESQAEGVFSAEADKEFYRKSANTNKKNKIDDADFLKKPSARAFAEYNKALEQAKSDLHNFQKMNRKHTDILKQHTLTSLACIESMCKNPTAKTLDDCTEALKYVSKTIQEMQIYVDDHKQKTIKNVKTLGKLIENLTDKNVKLRKVGLALAFFGLAALVVVGVITAIPSAGASLPAILAGIAGINALTTAGVVTAAAGAAIYGYNHNRGAVAKLSMFKSTVQEMNSDEPDVRDDSEVKNKQNIP